MRIRYNRAWRRERWKALRAKLEPLRPVLERQGSVRERRPRRGSGVEYVLRYRLPSETDPAERTHKTLYIGRDRQLADRVRDLLDTWRMPILIQKLEEARLGLYADLIAASRGFGRDRARRFRAWTREQLADPVQGFMNMKCGEQVFDEGAAGRTGLGRKSKAGAE